MSDGIAEQLFQRGALMSLHIGRWGAMKKMSAGDLLLKEVDDDALYLGHKKLLPKSAMEKLVELEGKARSTLAGKSIDFPIAGARFVSYSSVPTLMESLKSLKDDWDSEVEKLVADYPNLRTKQLELLERQAITLANEKLKADPSKADEMKTWLATQLATNRTFYPPADQLKFKFSFSWRMFRISNLDGINELDPEEVKNAQERLRNDLRQWIGSATAQIHQTLGEAAKNAQDILERNGKLTPRNIKPLFDAFESFLAVDFTGKSTFRENIESLKKGFLVQNPDGTYNLPLMAESVSGNEQFSTLLSKLSTLAIEDVAREAGAESSAGRFGRVLDL